MPAKRKSRGGKPSPYEGREVEIAKALAERLKTGEPLAQILRENRWPSHDALTDWRAKFPEVERIFARARLEGFDAIAAECLTIADASDEEEDSQRSKLRVETRLKLLAKWDPKRYGDKLELSGGMNNTLTVREPIETLRERVTKSLQAHARS